MPDSILHESMRQEITCFVFVFVFFLGGGGGCFFFVFFVCLFGFFWCGVILLVFVRMKEMESALSL